MRRIRALFKQAALEKIELDLNEVIGEVLHLLNGETAKKRITVETDLDQDLAPVAGDRVQLQQLVFNLLLNGIEAMDPVVDRLKRLSIRSKHSSPETVLVEVRDSGIGLKDPDRIFDAFFTTKESGMGMGLAICRSIVDAHQGRLWAAAGEDRHHLLFYSSSQGGLSVVNSDSPIVFVVDDDYRVREALRASFPPLDFEWRPSARLPNFWDMKSQMPPHAWYWTCNFREPAASNSSSS